MRIVGNIVLIVIAVVSLLVFFHASARAEAQFDECYYGRTGKEANGCRRQVLQEQRKLEEKPPVLVVAAPDVPRPYGYWVGDLTEFSYLLEFKPGVEADLSRLPAVGANVGEFRVRERSITEDVLPDGVRKVRVRYVVQNYVVLCQQQYVPFGPIEIAWRQSATTKWQRLELPPAKILISPMSLCVELPDAKLAPKAMMEFSVARVAWTLFGAGAALMLVAFAIFAKGMKERFLRHEASALWQAARILSRKDIDPYEAIAAFRTAMREKFGVSGADSADDVANRIAALPFWQPFAAEAAGLWDETTAVLYDERLVDAALVERIRSFINVLSRREVDE